RGRRTRHHRYVHRGRARPGRGRRRGRPAVLPAAEERKHLQGELIVSVPTELGYTDKHEWLVIEDGVATIGITAFAAESLGDIVYVEAPEVGSQVTAGEPCGEVES